MAKQHPHHPGQTSLVHRGLLQRVRESYSTVRESQTGPIILGFSGGVDSLSLAIALQELLGSAGLHLCHVDHGMRTGSAEEAKRAMKLAIQLGISASIVTAIDDPGVATPTSENEAREMRYVALAAEALRLGANTIALAHHRRDQAETLLLHLLRGTGVAGIASMKEFTKTQIPWWTNYSLPEARRFNVWRPFLYEAPATLDSIVSAAELTPVFDPSNQDPAFARNWLRSEVLPLLASRYPEAEQALARFARSASLDEALLEGLVDEVALNAGISTGSDNQINSAKLLTQPEALQRRLLIRWLRSIGVEEPTEERVTSLLHFLPLNNQAATLEIGSGNIARLYQGWLLGGSTLETERILRVLSGLQFWLDSDGATMGIEGSGRTILHNPILDSACTLHIRQSENESLLSNLTLRTLVTADRWAINDRKISDSLRKFGVPSALRRQVLAVVSPRGVEAIPGLPSPQGTPNASCICREGDS